jgi:hypothetical protein
MSFLAAAAQELRFKHGRVRLGGQQGSRLREVYVFHLGLSAMLRGGVCGRYAAGFREVYFADTDGDGQPGLETVGGKYERDHGA